VLKKPKKKLKNFYLKPVKKIFAELSKPLNN